MNPSLRLIAGLIAGLFCAALPGASASAASTAASAGRSTAPAPAAGPELPRLTAQQIVERNIAARGGLAAWRSIQSIRYAGSLDAGRARPDNGMNPSSTERLLDKPGRSTKPGQAPEQHASEEALGTPISLPYTLTMQRPHRQRLEVRFQDETLVQVYDGQHGWKLQPFLHRGVQPFTADELRKAQQFQEIDGPLVDYAAKGTQVALDGTDRVDGRPAYRLKLALKNGDTRRVWIDAESFLDVQIDGSRRFNGHEVAEYTALRDFRSVDGVKIPYLMETRVDGKVEHEKLVVQSVALNPKVDGAAFGKPQ